MRQSFFLLAYERVCATSSQERRAFENGGDFARRFTCFAPFSFGRVFRPFSFSARLEKSVRSVFNRFGYFLFFKLKNKLEFFLVFKIVRHFAQKTFFSMKKIKKFKKISKNFSKGYLQIGIYVVNYVQLL